MSLLTTTDHRSAPKKNPSKQPLPDHVSKTLDDCELARDQFIPKGVPEADWRYLKKIADEDSLLPEEQQRFSGEDFCAPDGRVVVGDLVPGSTADTAHLRHEWKGICGRIPYTGFASAVTGNPRLLAFSGMWAHPLEDRLVSVLDCRRLQGIPDHMKLSGTLTERHKQVGNAVPVPLAMALGKQLRFVLEGKG